MPERSERVAADTEQRKPRLGVRDVLGVALVSTVAWELAASADYGGDVLVLACVIWVLALGFLIRRILRI